MLIRQAYGGEAEWGAHLDALLPFFSSPEYAKVDGRPVFAIYNLRHMQTDAGMPPKPLQYCANPPPADANSCRGGCAHAELYLHWYPDLLHTVETAREHFEAKGEREGRAWPAYDPCVMFSEPESRLASPRLVHDMVAFWQRRAKEKGLPGLYIVGTVGGWMGSQGIDKLADAVPNGEATFDAMLQFMPVRACGD